MNCCTTALNIEVNDLSKSEFVGPFDGIIMSLWFLCEAWDKSTAYHQSRSACLAHAIAGEMDISGEKRHEIYMAALVHDIGKMALSRELIYKPTYLTDDEHREIQKHCSAGFAALISMGVSWPIPEAVLQHHERLDGSGYPNGVHDSLITLEARIISVADVLDALLSNRPYRSSLSLDVALAEIVNNKDTLYDANVVDACLQLFMQQSYTFSRPSRY